MKKHIHISSSFSLVHLSFARAAFTLIELMIVIAIVAVMAAIAAPRYGDALNRYRTDAAARRIAADFSLAHTRARASSTTRSIAFDATSSSYSLSGEQSLKLSSGAYNVNLASEPYYVSISTLNFGGNTSVTFNGYGVPSCSGYVQIGAGSASRRISIDPDTGVASIQ